MLKNIFQHFFKAYLNCGVVCVLVGYKECSFDVTSVGVFPFSIEDLIVKVNIVDVDSIVKRYGDHLGHFQAVRAFSAEVTRHLCAGFRAKAIWELANRQVTRRCPVWIGFTV